MNRRRFIQAMAYAAGTFTLPVTNGVASHQVSFKSGGVRYTLGYESKMDVTYLQCDYGKWQDLVEQTGNHINDPKMIFKSAKLLHQRYWEKNA